MEFKDLPPDIQRIAAHTLHFVLREEGQDLEIEPAKKLARGITAAFTELYSEDANSRLAITFDYAPCRQTA